MHCAAIKGSFFLINCTFGRREYTPMSTNVSKQKREELLAKIKAIRTYIATAPQDENTANLLAYLSELEKDVGAKKYGLVFEEHREEIDEVLSTHTPVLTEDGSLFIKGGGQMNFLIEGDNLASLRMLEKTHRGRIDVIYIDPPYNTGKEFVYNDDIVDTIDTFRHSKWLSFMSVRLNIARNLLSERGVIFLSIDDNEHSQLKLLADEIFSENNFVADFCVIRAEGGGLAKQVIKGHDYCLVYAKNISKFTPLAKPKDIRGKIVERNGKKYWIQEDWLRKEFGKYGNCHYEELLEYKGQEFKNEIDKGLRNGDYVLIPKSNGMNIIGKLRSLETDSSKFYSILKHLNKNGVNELKEIGVKFDYPKPLSLITELVSGATFFNRTATILDFFAGSGTTGHAVMKLNAEDGGSRRFILCTNNENNICREVTYERIKRVIDKEGYAASLKYFKVDYIPVSERMYYEYADELLAHIRELVELENGINFTGNAEVGIVLTEDELAEFIQNGEAFAKCRKLYMGHDLLPDEEQEKILRARGVEISIIPDYYYRDLQEG